MTNSLPTVSTITQNPNTGKFMCIMNNPKFRDSFIHNGQEYANYASALASAGLDTRFRSYIPETPEFEQVTLACTAFLSPSGQYYVVVPCGRLDVRVDCANVHTARAWQRDGVSVASFQEAIKEDLTNVRSKGYWGTC
jgi:hypothetical protein|tara:strand:- start:127 stop:540 length:414 start_codon:yes stop_codon:yes gene_type:complete